MKLISLYQSNVDDDQWQQFIEKNDCRPLITSEGSQRLSWQCRDGSIHNRWRQQR